MDKRAFIKAKGFYAGICLVALFVLYPMHLFGQAGTPEKPNKIEVKASRVSVDVQDAEIADVLKEIGKGSGVKMTIDQGLIGKKVTAKFEDKDVEGTLREILRGHYYVLSFTDDPINKEKKTLKEVKAKDDIIGSKTLKGKLITVDIPYGSGKGEVRAAKESEGGSIGPLSFAVDGAGTVYICDTWNRRIQVFSPSGSYQYTITLKEDIFATDIVVDDHGFVYVYDRGVRKLYQYDKGGSVLASIDIDSARGVMLPLHFINNAIYFDHCDPEHCSYFVIGRVLADNTLIKVPYQEQGQDQSTLTLSGKSYKGRKFIEGYNTQTDITDKNGLTSKMLSLPSEGVLPGDLFGEDTKGNFYLAVTYLKYEYQLYDVNKFDAEGNYVGTAKIPSGQREFWAVKEFELSKNGNIYNFIPGEKNLTLHIFLTQDN